MNFKDLKNKIKEEQKQIAQQISRGKYLRKPHRRENMTEKDKASYFYKGYNSNNYFYNQDKIDVLSDRYRHRHIAYCQLFNNTEYDKIEKPSDENRPNKSWIDEFKKEWELQIDEETLRNCA